jgi:putative MATE family efflux protein
MEHKTQQMDMLHGPLWRNIIVFSLPLAAASILQQLFNSADTAVVGRFANAQALAAVGTNGEIISLFVSLFTGLSIGANVLIAGYIGMGKTKQINAAIHTVMSLALLSGIVMLILGQFIAEPLLQMIDTPEDVMELAVEYLRLYFLGSPFLMIYNFGSAILRAKGDTKRPLYALLASGVINVILNLFFVIACHMSVAGVALATDISTAFSALVVVRCLQREEETFRFSWKRLSLNRKYAGRVFAIGLPAGIQGAVFCFSNVFIQAAINSFGSNAVAGSAAALNFEYFSYYMLQAFAQAATTFISQNWAAGEKKRCGKIFWLALVQGAFFAALISVPLVVFRSSAIQLYSTEQEVMEYAYVRIMTVLILEPLCVVFEVPAAALRGMGYSGLPAVETILGTVVFRLVWLATVFAHWHTFRAIFVVYPVSWVLTGAVIWISYRQVYRKAQLGSPAAQKG